MNPSLLRKYACLTLAVMVAVPACARSDKSGATDSAAAPAATPAADTAMAGMDHSTMAGMDHGPAKDADHDFLRKMVDHHESLIVMMDDAMERASSATAKADARKLHEKQHQERDRMVELIKASYGETHTPMVMPGAKAMNDSLRQKSGAAHDRDMYRHLVMHHQEGVKMIDDFLPRLKRAEVREMASRMRADQAKEIQDFQRKQAS